MSSTVIINFLFNKTRFFQTSDSMTTIITLIIAWIIFIILWKIIKTTIKTALTVAAMVVLLYFGFGITPQDILYKIAEITEKISQIPVSN